MVMVVEGGKIQRKSYLLVLVVKVRSAFLSARKEDCCVMNTVYAKVALLML